MMEFADRIRSQSRPLQPMPTQMRPKLAKLPGLRAVLFDIYGTLLISGSGDIGSDRSDRRRDSLIALTELFDLELVMDASEAIGVFTEQIRMEHHRLKQIGVAYPEVDYREVWSTVLPKIYRETTSVNPEVYALEFELRANPAWPMPHSVSTLAAIGRRGLMLGIVSNAQFFTPLLVASLMDQSLEDLGFSADLTYFSYEHRRAKPGTTLYEFAQTRLAGLDISPDQVLYVGNDMLNDIMAATYVGFRTALYAGDLRSLRLRSDDERVHDVEADIVVTELPQLIECLP